MNKKTEFNLKFFIVQRSENDSEIVICVVSGGIRQQETLNLLKSAIIFRNGHRLRFMYDITVVTPCSTKFYGILPQKMPQKASVLINFVRS